MLQGGERDYGEERMRTGGSHRQGHSRWSAAIDVAAAMPCTNVILGKVSRNRTRPGQRSKFPKSHNQWMVEEATKDVGRKDKRCWQLKAIRSLYPLVQKCVSSPVPCNLQPIR
jgi:hypothetical protein